MANVLLARCDDRIEIVATDVGTIGGFLALLLQLPRPARTLRERRRGARGLMAAEVMSAPPSAARPVTLSDRSPRRPS